MGILIQWNPPLALDNSALGIKTNRNSTNWYAIVGTENNHVIIAGCQIHYAVKCDKKPNDGPALGWTSDAQNGLKEYMQPCKIYFTEWQ